MTLYQTLRVIMDHYSISGVQLSKHLGYKNKNAVSTIFSKKNDMQFTTLCKFLNILHCDLIIRDQRTGHEYLIDTEEDPYLLP